MLTPTWVGRVTNPICQNWLSGSCFVPRLSPQKKKKRRGGEESLVTSMGKVVNFLHLALAVPIRLWNEPTCKRDILSTQQKLVNLKMNL